MWCTRWYLPLILLPLPIAPPFFLALFLLSLTLHARPCFYCIVLLTALFLSTCYWPPVSIETSLTTPWSENITTYADALLSLMPDLPQESLPTDIPIVEHCWCDLTSGKFFEPFDVTRWEVESVLRLKEELELQQRLKARIGQVGVAAQEEGEDKNTVIGAVPARSNSTVIAHKNALTSLSKWSSILSTMWPFLQGLESSASPSSSQDMLNTTGLIAAEPLSSPSSANSPRTVPSSIPLPRLRREYDLRPYGFEMTVDFGWSRS